jgi:hypothetical protein
MKQIVLYPIYNPYYNKKRLSLYETASISSILTNYYFIIPLLDNTITVTPAIIRIPLIIDPI